jgi:integrase/recombinase XerD
MRIDPSENRIFDTQVDTKKIFVPMRHSFKLRNYRNSEGKSPIILHVSQAGERERISMDLYIAPKLWDKAKGYAKEIDQEAIDINLILKNSESRITEIKTIYRLSGIHLTLEKFIEEFKNSSPRTDFIAFFSYQLELDKPEMAAGTYKNQKKVLNKVKKFKEKILFPKIDDDFIKKYKNYTIAEGNATTTMNNSLKVIKKYLIRAKKKGILFPLDPTDIVCGPTGGNRVDLDGLEINKMLRYLDSEFINDSHIVPLVKFLISCFTGLRISDNQQLKHIIVDDKLKFSAIKTGKRQVIQMPYTVQDLIVKYPQAITSNLSDQQINRVLKDIAKICGISKVVTFHVARHSFATNYLRMNGKIQVLQKLLGHSSIKETEVYWHIIQEEEDREMMIMDNIVIKIESPI